MVPASLNDKYVIRFCVCRETACDDDMSKCEICKHRSFSFPQFDILRFFLLVEYAWEVIKTVANEVERSEVGSPDSEVIPEPIPAMRRVSQEAQSILKALSQGRRYTLARQTSTINEVITRTSFDAYDDETVLPRSRKGSLYPASEFKDDFAEAVERERRASLIEIGEDKIAALRRLASNTSNDIRSSLTGTVIDEGEEGSNQVSENGNDTATA